MVDRTIRVVKIHEAAWIPRRFFNFWQEVIARWTARELNTWMLGKMLVGGVRGIQPSDHVYKDVIMGKGGRPQHMSIGIYKRYH